MPHCLSRLCGSHYYSDNKAWMHTEIMIHILTELNNRVKCDGRNILNMFFDNAPCHPLALKDNDFKYSSGISTEECNILDPAP